MKKTRFRFDNSLCVFLILLLSASFQLFSSSTKEEWLALAGSAVFPGPEAVEWMSIQVNPVIDNTEKVKATVNMYFTLLYESWRRGDLLNFGFLFDLSEVKAWNDYAYERGSLHVMVSASKVNNMLLKSYEYKPRFLKISIREDKAEVGIWPNASIIHRATPDIVDQTPWTDQIIKLTQVNGLWLIERVISQDPVHNLYPRKTDFNEQAESAVRALREERVKIEEYKKKHKKGSLDSRADIKSRINAASNTMYFDSSGCKWYAETYSSNKSGTASYSPYFVKFPNADCQNFVCQCIWFGWAYFGGPNYGYKLKDMASHIANHDLPMISDTVPNAINWWCDLTRTSYEGGWHCWINVPDFISMITINYAYRQSGLSGYRLLGCGSVDVGYIVTTQDYSHAMIVNYVADWDHDGLPVRYDEIYICAHTTNRKNVRLYDLNPNVNTWRYYSQTFWNPL